MSRTLLHLIALLTCAQTTTACSPPPQAADDPHPASTAPYTASELGFFARKHNETEFTFHQWLSEETINTVLFEMKRRRRPIPDPREGTAEIHFAPGRYVIDQWIFVNEVDDLTISGNPQVELVFRDGPARTTSTAAPIDKGVSTIRVEHPERIEDGRRYQIYQADGRGDRILEFEVSEVKDDLVHLKVPTHYMPHVKEIPVGSQVMEELNFFRVRQSPGFTLQGLYMDGRNRGGIRGHTIYSGVYATGLYKEHERATTLDMTIRNCTFKNLRGRGVVFYGMADVVIEGNYFEHIRAQAIEIDHFASGHIKHNHINGAEVGVMVNDAYESVVEGNHLRNCGHGVRFLEVYKDDWVNSGNIIRNNFIGPGCKAGVMFFNEGMADNLVTGNTFIGLSSGARVINGEGNRIELD